MARTIPLLLPAFLLALLALVGLPSMTGTPVRADQLAQVTPPPPPNAPKATEPDPTEIAEWFVSPAGKALGPHTVGELIEMAAAGKIDARTPVWKEGMADWALLRDIPELQPVVAAQPKSDAPKPPPPVNTQALLDQAIFEYVIGTWRHEGFITDGGYRYRMVLELTYRSDGSYAGTQMVEAPAVGNSPPHPFVYALSGTFEVTAVDEANFVLTIHSKGEVIQSSLRIVDRNTLEDAVDRSKRSYRIR